MRVGHNRQTASAHVLIPSPTSLLLEPILRAPHPSPGCLYLLAMSFGSANGDEMHWGTRKKKSSNRKQPVAEPQAVFPKEDPTEELLAALKG